MSDVMKESRVTIELRTQNDQRHVLGIVTNHHVDFSTHDYRVCDLMGYRADVCIFDLTVKDLVDIGTAILSEANKLENKEGVK